MRQLATLIVQTLRADFDSDVKLDATVLNTPSLQANSALVDLLRRCFEPTTALPMPSASDFVHAVSVENVDIVIT